MKKTLFILTAIAAMVASCTKTEVDPKSTTAGNAIGFSTYAMGTKADPTYDGGDVSNTELVKGHFGVVGYNSSNAIYLGSTTKAAEQEYISGSSSWEYVTASELRFWPAGKMAFYAYFPYEAATTATFNATNGSSTTPLQITGWTDGRDVLVASALNQEQAARTSLTFKHALSKIESVTVQKGSGLDHLTISISNIEIQATSKTATINMSETGAVTYSSLGATARSKTHSTPVEAAASTAASASDLIVSGDKAYIIPTGTAAPFTGTGTTMWDGSASANVVNDKVCIKLTGKVFDTRGDAEASNDIYYVGDSSNDGVFYIPMCTSSVTSPTTVTSLVAGKKYTYNITMNNNVGYDVNGKAILSPIKFSAEVTNWDDSNATITITL